MEKGKSVLKKWILAAGMLLALGLPTLAQDATPEATVEGTAEATQPWQCPKGFEGQTLNIYNFSGYVAEDTVSNFEKACGVTVTYDVYVTNEEMVARLTQGNPGYDIVVPSNYIVSAMLDQKLLEPLDMQNIPNFANISQDLTNPPYDPGNQYTVPYQWGTIGIAYNKTKVGQTVDSWQQMFDYKGSVAWLEDIRAMLGIGLIMQGHDPNTTSPDEIQSARDFLVNHSKNVVTIVQANSKDLLAKGEVDIAIDYPGNVFQLIAECSADPNCKTEYAYAIPKEGTIIWIDNLAIPKGAPHKALAEAYIDYILDPKVGADLSNYIAYASPNQKAIDLKLINADLLSNTGIYPDAETRKNLFFARSLPDVDQLYNDAWDEVKIKIGQK
jgi:spermidine/putrescine transport system substrate-binding protein